MGIIIVACMEAEQYALKKYSIFFYCHPLLEILNLVSESSRLYGLTHKHVLPLLATTSDGSSPMMIYAYTNPGNLKKWLISSGHQVLSTHQVVSCVT